MALLRLAWHRCSWSSCYASHTKFLTGSLALKGTELERACTATIRTKPIKIGAAIVRTHAVCGFLWRPAILSSASSSRQLARLPHKRHPVLSPAR